MSKQEEIIEIAGKKVVVRYARTQEDACASCAFCSRKECHDLDCNMRDIVGESVCKYAYFVEAEQLVPSDVQEAANQYIGYPPEVDEGVSISLRRQAFADGMLAERERQMKEAAYFPEYDSIVNKVFGAGNLESWELDEAKRLVSLAKAELLKDLASGPTIKGWVARDENGTLWLYGKMPYRKVRVWTTLNGRNFFRIDNTLFPSLRWEDEPKPVRVIIEEIK